MSSRARATASALVIGASSVLIASTALAQATGEGGERAEKLFQEGKTLMADKRFAEACPKFQESQRLDPATGTLLALALCHEGQGKIATAWREFKQALPSVQSDKRRDRESLVVGRIVELAPRLPKIVLAVPAETASDSTLSIRVDGERIERSAWSAPLPVDLGTHTVEVTAQNKSPWTGTVVINAERETRTIAIAPPAADAAPTSGFSQRRSIALAVGSVGIISLAAGSIFGLRALDKSSEAKGLCDPQACSSSDAVAINDDASSAATVSTIGIALGVIVLAGGVYLWLTDRGDSNKTIIALRKGLSGVSF